MHLALTISLLKTVVRYLGAGDKYFPLLQRCVIVRLSLSVSSTMHTQRVSEPLRMHLPPILTLLKSEVRNLDAGANHFPLLHLCVVVRLSLRVSFKDTAHSEI